MRENYKELVDDFGDETRGKDPRNFSVEKLNELGFVQKSLSKVIKEMCSNCCGSDPSKPRSVAQEVLACTCITCPLWLYRTGKNPFAKRELTDEQRQIARDRFKNNLKKD